MTQEFRRILIVRTDRIGDVILTLPMARLLKKKFPDAHIAMLIRRYTVELVDENSDINQIIFYDNNDRLLPFFQLVSILRAGKFEVVFHTYPRFRLALMTWFAGIPVRVGTGYRWYSFFFNQKIFEHRKDALRHELEYNLNLLKVVGCSADGETVQPSLEVKTPVSEKVKKILLSKGLSAEDKLIILHPGSGGSARDWSGRNFGLLGQRLAQLQNVKVVIVGGSKERQLVETVRVVAGDSSVSFVNELNLKEYAALAKFSALFIGNSTGPIHIAAAVGTPVIGLYPRITALSPRRWGPYTEKKTIFTPANQAADCNKCQLHKSEHCECMDEISVDSVFNAAITYLN